LERTKGKERSISKGKNQYNEERRGFWRIKKKRESRPGAAKNEKWHTALYEVSLSERKGGGRPTGGLGRVGDAEVPREAMLGEGKEEENAKFERRTAPGKNGASSSGRKKNQKRLCGLTVMRRRIL